MRNRPDQIVRSARYAQRRLATADAAVRSAVLQRLSDALNDRRSELLVANQRDLTVARDKGLAGPLLHRLALSEEKLEGLREGVQQLASTPDPVGGALRATELDTGLVLRQVRSPLGVLLVIFESRPDAVIQIGSLSLRSGNAVLLKGGSEAVHSNRALVGCLRDALTDAGLDPDAVIPIEGRQAVKDLLALDGSIDLVIPRGSNALVREIQASTRIPVLGHADGICHLFLDRRADAGMAARLAVDGKCDYPAACNATETLLVHRDFLPQLADVAGALRAHDVTLRANEEAREVIPWAEAASEQDWSTEWGDLTLSVRTVADIDEAIDHIHRFGSGHTDAIVTGDGLTADRFLREVDSASVFVNASTRFADGYRYGLGAEVGISAGRIHARGPVGVEGLLTTRWLLEGEGHVAGDYGPGKRSFLHRALEPETVDRESRDHELREESA